MYHKVNFWILEPVDKLSPFEGLLTLMVFFIASNVSV